MRLVIAEDSALLREGLTQILTRFGHHVRAVNDATGLLAAATEDRPDAVITDVRMPPDFRDEGLRAALELRDRDPRLPVLVLSQYVEQTYAADLVATGNGVGYLLKDRVGEVTEFIDALERVAAGGTVIDPEVIRQLLARRRGRNPLDRLTPRALGADLGYRSTAAVWCGVTVPLSVGARFVPAALSDWWSSPVTTIPVCQLFERESEVDAHAHRTRTQVRAGAGR